MSSIYVFNLCVRGSRPQREAVAQYVRGRITTNDGNYIIDTDDKWASMSTDDEEDLTSICQQSDDHSALLIEGGTNAAPGLWLANEISAQFPDLQIRIGGEDEEGGGELWEVVNAEPRLLAIHRTLCFSELRFCVKYWIVKNGEEVTPEQRQIKIAEAVARHAVESGIEYTPEQIAVVQNEINRLEEDLRGDTTEPTNASSNDSDVSDEEFLTALKDESTSQEIYNDATHVHTWVVFSTAVRDGWLMLQCCDCGLHGVVKDPSSEEWSEAFHAPSKPFQWLDETRIVPQLQVPSTQRYVMRSENVAKCDCYSKRRVIAPANFERCANEITRPALHLTGEGRQDLRDMAKIVRDGRLCSFLFEFFLTCAERDTGASPSSVVHRIAKRFTALDRKGMHCSPAVVARLLEDIAQSRTT